MKNMTDLTKNILANNTEDDVKRRIDAAIPDFVGPGWEDEFDDIFEAYAEQGRGEAESQVLKEIIESASQSQGLTDLTTDQYCEVFNKLTNEWGLTV